MTILEHLTYYYWASFRRKLLDKYQEKYKKNYHGVVLDIGGRSRGKFKKPISETEKWIFADISTEYKPDIVLDITNMHNIDDKSIDVVSAMEVFEYVEKTDNALMECHRILKDKGVLMLSSPFLHPIANDPCDLQRWTKAMWEKKLIEHGFTIKSLEEMGNFFTVLAEFINLGNKSLKGTKYLGYVFYPLLSLMTNMDNFNIIKKNTPLNSFTTGYFIIAEK